jgi:hypothetical protein
MEFFYLILSNSVFRYHTVNIQTTTCVGYNSKLQVRNNSSQSKISKVFTESLND